MLYASDTVISKPRYFGLFFSISLGTIAGFDCIMIDNKLRFFNWTRAIMPGYLRHLPVATGDNAMLISCPFVQYYNFMDFFAYRGGRGGGGGAVMEEERGTSTSHDKLKREEGTRLTFGIREDGRSRHQRHLP